MPPLEASAQPLLAASAEVEWIDSPAELARLHEPWAALWRADPQATPFQSPGWLLPWWRSFGAEHELAVLAWRDEATLLGLAPFVMERTTRVLRLLGCGISDYLDVLARPEQAATFPAAVWERLAAASGGWRALAFEGLRARSPLRDRAGVAGLPLVVAAGEPSPCLPLDSGDDALPAAWRRKLAYDWRRLRRTGRVEIVAADAANLAGVLATHLRLHTARWAADGQPGGLSTPELHAFHVAAATEALRAGSLQLRILNVDGRPVASYHGFLHRGRAWYYLGGTDPAWHRFGVGNLLVDHVRQEAAAAGATTLDFLRGREPYKYRWGARDEPTWSIHYEREAGT